MKNIRLGNDIQVKWTLLSNDNDFYFHEDYSYKLYLKNNFEKREVDFTISDNIIEFTFLGKEQKHIGRYSLTLVINEGEVGMVTVDSEHFVNLVICSCNIPSGSDIDSIETQTIEFESNVGVTQVMTLHPDWNADEGEVGYIKNRTHYETAQDKTIYQSVCGYGEIYEYDDIYGVEVGIDGFYDNDGREREVRFLGAGGEYETKWQDLYTTGRLVFYGKGANPEYGYGEITGDGYEDIRIVSIFRGKSGYTEALEISNPYDVGLVCEYREKPVVTPLGERFIPDTIARKSELTELREELTKKTEVHIIWSIDSFNGRDDLPMRDADVDAILSGKLIAANSPTNGYVLADEVYYEELVDNPRMGFIVFHYDNNEIKVVFDLTNKVYLGSQSYIKAIAQKEYVDGKLTELSEGIGKKADKDGVYSELTAGDLAGRGESVPASFGFRASGGKSIKDGRAYIKSIKGNSVVWNQWAKSFEEAYEKPYHNEGITYNGNKVTIDNWRSYQPFRFDIKCSTAKDHLYLVLLNYANTNPDQLIYIEFGGENSIYQNIGNIAYFHRNIIYNNDYKDAFTLYVSHTMEGTVTLSDLQVIDLTKMFGAGNEPITIEEYNARKPIVADEYAYNEGEVIHMTAEGIKSVGDNALNADRSLVFDFDGSYGNYDFINTEDAFVGISADGYIHKEAIDYAEKIEGGFRLRSNSGGYGIGLFVKALPNEEYSVSYASDNGRIAFGFYDKGKNFISYQLWENRFTTPSNCEYIMLCLRDNEVTNIDISFTDIMLTLVHSGWKQDTDAGYQPYWQDALPLPIIRKYFPDGMKKAGTAHDEIRNNKASGKWEYSKGKIKSVDLGTLNWYYPPTLPVFMSEVISDMRAKPGVNVGLIGKYFLAQNSDGQGMMEGTEDKVYVTNGGWVGGNGVVAIRDTSYTDVESFKADMAGVMLYYESKDWEWVELDAEDQNFRDYYNVADFGTEQSQSSVPSAPFSADIIYQFNAVDMIREHELEITELQSIIATMQAQLASLTNS